MPFSTKGFCTASERELTCVVQIISAIQIAWDPAADQTLKRQAFEYVNQLRNEPSVWQPCLSVFVRQPPQAEVVRVFCLEIVNSAVQAGLLDEQGLKVVKDQLLEYLRRSYGTGDGPSPDSTSIENKLAQTITYLFSAIYSSGWESCFDDLLSLATTTTQPGTRNNAKGIAFYLRVVNSIHDEIGDVLLSRSRSEQDKANTLKDLLRDRDVRKIAISWQEVLSQWSTSNDLVAELCLKAIGKWVSWIDISLVVNESMLELLFQQLERAQQIKLAESAEKARDSAIDVFTEITSKKMSPSDKVNLISFLNTETVVSQLIACPPLKDSRGSSTYDVDLAETVAKLVNATTIDIVKILDTEGVDADTYAKAERMLATFLPHLLRFFSDEYDEVCSTVLNAMNDVLGFLRRASQGQPASPQRAVMLLPIIKAVFAKMRYDETASWGDDDEKTDEAEFQDLRKRLASLQQAIAASDEQLYIDSISGLVHDTLQKLQTEGSQLNWRDVDLALYEIFLLGDLAIKSGGLYQKNKPHSPAAEKLIRMMLEVVQSNVGSFGHPAVQLQYMEICVRYSTFFEHHTQHIEATLQNFLQLAHHHALKVRARSWYLLHRFIRQLRTHIGAAAEVVIQRMQDLLVIKAELPSEDDDGMSSDGESGADAVFMGQLDLFEAAGCIIGANSVPSQTQVQLVQAVIQPAFNDVQQNLNAAKQGNEQAILQIHHDLMALGNVARGFGGFLPGSAAAQSKLEASVEVRQAFGQVAEATLMALGSLKSSAKIREAARAAFSRLMSMVGSEMMQQLPQWIDGLLAESASRDEMALFLRALDQVVFNYKNEIYDFLDRLFTGLLQRVFAGISGTTSGTDDEIELAELKREYLNFLLVVLGNDLGAVIVSATNQPMFDTVIGTLEHFAKDVDDYPTAKMSFQVMARMCSVWGGPDTVPMPNMADGTALAKGGLPGFDQFMMTRVSPLIWAVPANAKFNAGDAQARQVLSEAAGLQMIIYHKVGNPYVTYLRDNELRSMGMDDSMINDYLQKLSTSEMKGFKNYFAKFIAQGGKV